MTEREESGGVQHPSDARPRARNVLHKEPIPLRLCEEEEYDDDTGDDPCASRIPVTPCGFKDVRACEQEQGEDARSLSAVRARMRNLVMGVNVIVPPKRKN